MGVIIRVNVIVIFFVLKVLLITQLTVEHILEMLQTVLDSFLFLLFILRNNHTVVKTIKSDHQAMDVHVIHTTFTTMLSCNKFPNICINNKLSAAPWRGCGSALKVVCVGGGGGGVGVSTVGTIQYQIYLLVLHSSLQELLH